MLTLGLSVVDLLRCRFATSAVGEVVEVARAIGNPSWEPHNGWRPRHAPSIRRLAGIHDLRPLLALLAADGRTPDFLRPVPAGPTGFIAAELEQIAATPNDEVVAEVERSWLARGPVEREVVQALAAPNAAETLA